MKQFLYCEYDGGAGRIVEGSAELDFLAGWRDTDNEEEDFALCDFMCIAMVGEYHEHRLGICVRLKDKQQVGD